MRRWQLALFTVVVSGCASQPTPDSKDADAPPGSDRYSIAQDRAPSTPVDVSQIPEPTPRQEPRSRFGNPPQYVVWGQTYTVMDNAEGYEETGNASWYGEKFHGHRTSSGEPFDMFQLTAAHRSLPLPAYVRVTNLDNDKSIIVRVNDRGPFHSDRIIDLSWAAAVRLGVDQVGVAPVHVEALVLPSDPASAEAQQTQASSTAAAPPRLLFLQLGAFQQSSGAERLQNQVLSQLGESAIKEMTDNGFYRVLLGPFSDENERHKAQQRLAEHGLDAGMPIQRSDALHFAP